MDNNEIQREIFPADGFNSSSENQFRQTANPYQTGVNRNVYMVQTPLKPPRTYDGRDRIFGIAAIVLGFIMLKVMMNTGKRAEVFFLLCCFSAFLFSISFIAVKWE